MITVAHVTLPFPPSSNTAYPSARNGRRHPSKAGTAWQRAATKSLADLDYTLPPGKTLQLLVCLYMPDNRLRDLDNYNKLVQDAICARLGIDDNWRVVSKLEIQSGGVDKGNPRAEVLLREVDALLCEGDCR